MQTATIRGKSAAMPAASKGAVNKQHASSWKLFIMAASLAATLAGWGALALDQGQAASAASAAPLVQPSSTSGTTTQGSAGRSTLRQVTGPAVQPNIITRTRSSR